MKLFNIHNTENFYKVIDACKAPVLVSASDGRSEDFRNNTLLRELAGCPCRARSFFGGESGMRAFAAVFRLRQRPPICPARV